MAQIGDHENNCEVRRYSGLTGYCWISVPCACGLPSEREVGTESLGQLAQPTMVSTRTAPWRLPVVAATRATSNPTTTRSIDGLGLVGGQADHREVLGWLTPSAYPVRPLRPPCLLTAPTLRLQLADRSSHRQGDSCLRSIGRCADLRFRRSFGSVSPKLSEHH